MNRRQVLKSIVGASTGALLLRLGGTAALVEVASGFACSKADLTATAKDVLDSLKSAQPYITQLLPAKAAVFAALVEEAGKLVTAVASSNKQDALNLLADITPVFTEIASDLHGNSTVLAILAVADIGLHFLVNHIQVPTNGRLSARMGRIAAFKAQRSWGCDYHPEKCR
jgi:hypothetical protein